MKKQRIIYGLMLAVAFVIVSCGGSSIESDAKKYAELMCRAQKIAAQAAASAATGDMSSLAESTKLATEAAALAAEMEQKYTESDYEKFSLAYFKAYSECK